MENKIFQHRRNLLPFLAKKLVAKTYLEIGVKGGKTFLPIRVRKKIAVDPKFTIKKDYKTKQIWKYPLNYFAQYFECTSDHFFEKHCDNVLQKKSIDLAFIDGLHTYEQTYKDIENTLPYLKDEGIILVHDCSPKSAASAYPAESIADVKKINPPGFDGLWSGDVWKVIPRIKKDHPKLTVFVIDHDSGLGVISKSKLFDTQQTPTSKEINYTVEDIASWNYEYLNERRDELINVIEPVYLKQHCTLFNK